MVMMMVYDSSRKRHRRGLRRKMVFKEKVAVDDKGKSEMVIHLTMRARSTLQN